MCNMTRKTFIITKFSVVKLDCCLISFKLDVQECIDGIVEKWKKNKNS